MEESTELLPRANLRTEVSADDSSEVPWVVELFLRTMRERTPQTERAALRILCIGIFLGPVRTWLWTVRDGDHSARVLVVVCVDARLPIVLHADWAPESLELVHEELLRQSSGRLLFLVDREERRAHLLSRMRKGASRATSALRRRGKRRAEALLLTRRLCPLVVGPAPFVARRNWPIAARVQCLCTDSLPRRRVDRPVRVPLGAPDSEFRVTVRKATHGLPTTSTSIATTRLVLRQVV
mmetsp:Transcript_3148/g.9170  ORF Transcript_3148/g.9170 Transcript_3148/m.9170 type:complete len:239 (+) Transcript_3148:812-1528(+)